MSEHHETPGHHEIKVRGRDFRGYRIGGAIVALLLAVALVWQIAYVVQGHKIVVPEVSWVASTQAEGTSPAPGALEAPAARSLASEVLTQRTRLMDERYRSGPAPDEPPPALSVGPEERLETRLLAVRDTTLPGAWAQPDEQTLEIMRPSEKLYGYAAAPYATAAIFERPDGRAWRRGMSSWVSWIGGLAILGTGFLVAAVLAVRGRVPIAIGRDGRTVKRFGFLERANHWMTAGSFIMLALTGIVISYGTTLIWPVFGESALAAVGWVSTWGHMMFAPPFFLGICVMLVVWILRNLPEPSLDLPWLVRLGGFMSDNPDNPPAKKFNAGQKLTFWVAVLGGLAMTVSGVVLMFPFWWLSIDGMTWMMLAHGILGLLLIAFFIGHAYIGTVGMQDAIDAMWSGNVDLNWAREHHELWLDELDRKGQLPPGVHRHSGTAPAASSAHGSAFSRGRAAAPYGRRA